MNLGGPVWHASAAPISQLLPIGREALRAHALEALDGVGSVLRGEWEEWTGNAYHVRRRLSEAEEAHVGPVVDVRGTAEAERRYTRAQRFLPAGVPLV